MMLLVFGLAITLASFLAVNVVVSLAVSAATPWRVRRLSGIPLRLRPRALFLLRMLPTAGGIAVATGLVIPAYLLYEPADAGEPLTLSLAVVAGAAVTLMVLGGVRAALALFATAALVRRWMRSAEPVALPGAPVAAYRVRDGFPVFAVVGLRRARLFVSAQVLDALTPAELAAAVAHERSHLDAGDNLKRLIMRAAPDLLALLRASRTLEAEWAGAVESVADERAAGGHGERALALAAGLVKVARLAPSSDLALPVSALHDGGDVESRVRRLLAGPDEETAARARVTWPLWAGVAAVAVVLGTALPAVHQVIELAARLLR